MSTGIPAGFSEYKFALNRRLKRKDSEYTVDFGSVYRLLNEARQIDPKRRREHDLNILTN